MLVLIFSLEHSRALIKGIGIFLLITSLIVSFSTVFLVNEVTFVLFCRIVKISESAFWMGELFQLFFGEFDHYELAFMQCE